MDLQCKCFVQFFVLFTQTLTDAFVWNFFHEHDRLTSLVCNLSVKSIGFTEIKRENFTLLKEKHISLVTYNACGARKLTRIVDNEGKPHKKFKARYYIRYNLTQATHLIWIMSAFLQGSFWERVRKNTHIPLLAHNDYTAFR